MLAGGLLLVRRDPLAPPVGADRHAAARRSRQLKDEGRYDGDAEPDPLPLGGRLLAALAAVVLVLGWARRRGIGPPTPTDRTGDPIAPSADGIGDPTHDLGYEAPDDRDRAVGRAATGHATASRASFGAQGCAGIDCFDGAWSVD